MTGYQIRHFAEIMAAQARIEGMKAANQERAYTGSALAYGEREFQYEAGIMQDHGHRAACDQP